MSGRRKIKVHSQVTLRGHKVRVVEDQASGEFQAQIKVKNRSLFADTGPTCETMDHAFYWAFRAIKDWLQDGTSLAKGEI